MTPLSPELERTARRRAGLKLGWFIHAGVDLLLAALSAASGRHWAVFPALGWGLGLAIHGVVVFLVAGGGAYESLVERERRQLAAQKDPW